MEERKINIDREPLTSAEIATRKDFQQVLSGARPFVKPPFYKTGWFTTTIAGVAIIATTTIASFMLNKSDPEATVSAATTTGAEPQVEESFDYDEDTPCVNPPLQEHDVEYSNYTINIEEGGTITHPSGSEITVPRFAFVDDQGNELSGEMQIRYREFHDQFDILMSGIPMDYDSAGNKYNFESAGMMEILGFQNGKPVYIKPKKPIEVSMYSNNPSPSFSIYNLDEDERNWKYIGKDKVIVQEPEDGSTMPVAELSMEEILEQPELKENLARINTIEKELDIAEGEHQKAKQTVEQFQKQEPAKPRKVNPGNYNFDLAVNANEFPEIAIYKNVKFEVSPDDKSFSPQVYNIRWSDAEITEKVKGKTYNLTLTKGNDIRTFEVYPAFEGANYQAAIEVFRKKFEAYDRKLQSRRHVESEKKALYEAKLSEWEKARQEQAKLLAQYRKDVSPTGGGEDDDSKKEKISTRTKIARVFAVLSFGIWNADRTVLAKPKGPKGQKVMASFVDGHGDPILLSRVQLIQRNLNSVYNYPSTKFDKLQWDPEENNVIVAISPSGRMGYCNSQYIKDIPEDKKAHTFELTMLDARNMSSEELRREMNL